MRNNPCYFCPDSKMIWFKQQCNLNDLNDRYHKAWGTQMGSNGPSL